ncbi:MAG: hypothetical protein P8Y27_04980 [Chromatiaceae bacterium]
MMGRWRVLVPLGNLVAQQGEEQAERYVQTAAPLTPLCAPNPGTYG